jgi:hypothetical protein
MSLWPENVDVGNQRTGIGFFGRMTSFPDLLTISTANVKTFQY